jgi:hypothetical protein
MSLFLRFFVILFAFFVACFAASLVVAYGLIAPEFAKLSTAEPEVLLGFLFLVTAAGIVTPFYVFAPAALIIFISEMFSLRSVLYYALMGAFVGALAYVLSDVTARMQGAGTVVPLTRELQFMVAGGIVGGFVYWLIAGRRAGFWKGA